MNLDTGRSVDAATDSAGVAATELAPGLYTVDTTSGYQLVRGPRVVSLASGQVLAATLAFAAPEQAPATGAGGLVINHDAVTCLVACQFPQFEAMIQPSEKVSKAKLYFKSARTTDLSHVDMVPGVGNYLGTMPRPTLKASPITYFIEAAESGQTRTVEVQAIVVEKAQDCEGRKMAVIVGSGPATALSASGDEVVPEGYGESGCAAAGIFGLSNTTVAIIGAGILAAGVITIVATGGQAPASPSR